MTHQRSAGSPRAPAGATASPSAKSAADIVSRAAGAPPRSTAVQVAASGTHQSPAVAPDLARRLARRAGLAVWLLGPLAVFAIGLLAVGVGSVSIPLTTVLRVLWAQLPFAHMTPDWPETYQSIVMQIRLPRVILVALTGASLATSGAAYQGLFHNPLADPYLIGVASGAGLGAVVAISFEWQRGVLGVASVPVAAFSTALLTVALVYALGRVGRSAPTTTLILAGVAVGALATALSTFIIMSASNQPARVLSYLLGGYGGAGWDSVLVIAPFALCGSLVLWMYARPLNVLLFDEEQARQLGIDVERVKLLLIVTATLCTAAAVSFSGLIGFVGLIVPHALRLVVGPDHRRLIPLSWLAGAGFLMLGDLAARTVIAPQELPLGVVTAFVGAPFFIYLLRRAKHAAFY